MNRIVNLHIAPGAGILPSVTSVCGRGVPTSRPNIMSESYHQPVLLQEVMNVLSPATGECFVDCTLGGGGHTRALLESGVRVIAIDQDDDAIAHASKWAAANQHGDGLTTAKANFRHIEAVLHQLGIEKVDGILADLGISSHHVDEASRGFSFQQDGPLDMRMDRTNPLTASRICNEAAEDELLEIFRSLGEEPRAKSVAKGIVERRSQKPFITTADLAIFVASIIPRRSGKHPATKIFQALRLAVNDELGALDALLEVAPRVLKPGGRLAVIAFHSLEDRRVKQYFRQTCTSHLDRPEWPEPRPNPHYFYEAIQRRGITASPEEVQSNPRARSATLRAATRI